jgi:hypothetical protein
MKKVIGLFFALLVCSAAQSENYYSASAIFINGESGEFSIDYSAITGTFGTIFNENMSGELRFGVGVDGDSIEAYGDKFTSEIDYYYGAYLKFNSSSGQIMPYAIIGLTMINESYMYASEGEWSSDSEDDFSYGFGVDFESGLNIEYTQFFDKNNVEMNGLSIGMKF